LPFVLAFPGFAFLGWWGGGALRFGTLLIWLLCCRVWFGDAVPSSTINHTTQTTTRPTNQNTPPPKKKTVNQLWAVLPASAGLEYMDAPLLRATVDSLQRNQERFWQMLRREMQQFDEVLEGYRRNLYALRRLVLCGPSEQLQRVVHLYIQVGWFWLFCCVW
jgi:hypothetical protein